MLRLAVLKKQYCTDIAKIINEYCIVSKQLINKIKNNIHNELQQISRGSYKDIEGSEILEELERRKWNVHMRICLGFSSIIKITDLNCKYCLLAEINRKKKKSLADILRVFELKRGLYREPLYRRF
jgi:hypothetical protein